MKAVPRVAFFTDSFYEINGVANTSRQFVKFAQRQQRPLLCVNADTQTRWTREGPFTQLALERGRLAIRLDDNLSSDLLLWRHLPDALKAVRDFAPDVLHITGPSDMGQLGAYVAHKLKIPLVASWHTNIHEYAANRVRRYVPFLAPPTRVAFQKWIERRTFHLARQFYQLARVLLAPNEELQRLLAIETGKPVFLMQRGVDTECFAPAHRLRLDQKFKLGYVGRLRPEKNVRAFVALEEALLKAEIADYQFVIVGEGSEQEWLNRHLRRVVFTGNLTGLSLARTYANFDLFVFPSNTDTFGNVVLEALASGVPAVVMAGGGPKFLIEPGKCGAVARDEKEMAEAVVRMMREFDDPTARQMMRDAARARALTFSWTQVFERVYEAYEACLSTQQVLEVEGSKSAKIQPTTSTMSKS
ncbi:MAG: glycosyltransferase [Blastocatellia bacterium]|nr:glycosyltransferase [Blastocatellia bacterium]